MPGPLSILKLPNPERAIVDIAKLRAYSLNPEHSRGKHKARVFAAALGLREEDAGWLRSLLLEAVHRDARTVEQDEFGTYYVIDFEVRTPTGAAVIRSSWIVRAGEDSPRLTTCYVKRDR